MQCPLETFVDIEPISGFVTDVHDAVPIGNVGRHVTYQCLRFRCARCRARWKRWSTFNLSVPSFQMCTMQCPLETVVDIEPISAFVTDVHDAEPAGNVGRHLTYQCLRFRCARCSAHWKRWSILNLSVPSLLMCTMQCPLETVVDIEPISAFVTDVHDAVPVGNGGRY